MDNYYEIEDKLRLLLKQIELTKPEDQSNDKYRSINNLRNSILNLLADMSLAEEYYKTYIYEK